MHICLDIDNTIVKNDIVENAIKSYNLPEEYSWDLREFPENIRKECFDKFNDPNIMMNLEPKRGARSKIYRWGLFGYNMTCVTSRSLKLKEITDAFIKTNFPEITNPVIYVENNSKKETFKKYNFDVIIDDNPFNIEEAISLNCIKKIFLISTKTTPYNHYLFEQIKQRQLYPNVFSVKNISEVIISDR